MSQPGARSSIPGVVALVAALALIGAGVWVKLQDRAPVQARAVAAESAQQASARALEAALEGLGTRAVEVARTEQLANAFDNQIDGDTFQNLFDEEEWWGEVRKNYAVSAAVISDGGSDRLLARLGPVALARAASSLVDAARTRGRATGIVLHEARPYLMAAAQVVRAEKAARNRPVLVLGQLADEKFLAAVADQSRQGVALSDGQRLLVVAGPPTMQAALDGLAGREGGGTVTTRDPAFAAIPTQIGPGLWLWSAFAAPDVAALPPPALAAFGLGVLMLVLAIALLMRARSGRLASAYQQHGHAHALSDSSAGMVSPSRPPTTAGRHPTNVARAPTTGGTRALGRGHGEVVSLPSRGLPRTSVMPSEPGELGSQPTALPGMGASAAVALSSPSTPARMGRYKLLKLIGEGGMAEVYVASAQGVEGFERYFVIKRLHPHLRNRKEVVSQFIDEARLQARLLHSNIVSVFDFGTDGDEYFLALEYIHGRDFEKVVQRHVRTHGRALPVSVVCHVAREILGALAYAHARTSAEGEPLGIVHRDVSPANVLISFEGEVKLSDFGIVKADARVSQTDLGVVKGNVSYMSPEQARSENVDLRSDLFSLGLLMFYALTGRTFYSGETSVNRLMLAAVGPDAQRLAQLDDLPGEAAGVLRRALALDPAQRYQSAEEFGQALGRYTGDGRTEIAELMKTLYTEEKRRDY